ncbi:MAG: FAD/FMN-containing dehydrogenase, partial [Planctomycetota bacterium]
MPTFLNTLATHLSDDLILIAENIDARYLSDYSGLEAERPLAVVRPRSTEEVSTLLRLCHENNQCVVPQGGMTGIVAGALPTTDAIVLSLERMSAIEEIDKKSATMTVQAGTPLSSIQEAANDAGFLFPLDIGARDSCLIGGNVSTNAGGNRVVKYGMTRNLILGMEVVLADGTIISSLNKMIKNNSGYDLKQLFIGAEGTLGIITRLVLKLSPRPRSTSTALCAMPDFDKTIALLHDANECLPGGVSSFEVMWPSFYKTMTDRVEYITAPLSTDYPVYVILECMGQNPDKDQEVFEAFLEDKFTDETIVDAVVAKSEAEVQSIWAIRDSVIEFTRLFPKYVGFDVSVPISAMEAFVNGVDKELSNNWPELDKLYFGHIGDSNLHLIIDITGKDPGLKKSINDLVYGKVRENHGAVSAEHGIGISKKEYLGHSVSEEEIKLMKTIKKALDPRGIL